MSSKILIAYFSHSGNTRTVAEQIHTRIGGELFSIETVVAYPSDYHTVVEQAKREWNSGYCPPLKTKINHLETYDILLIGSPNWWGTIAPPIRTFLENMDGNGKTLAPFITHEGSGLGRAEADLQKLCPKATVLHGLAIRGGSIRHAQNEIQHGLQKLGFDII